jgi:large subunit ribosomal protein L4
VVSDFQLAEIKTKGLSQVLDKLNVAAGSLLVDVNGNENLRMSARNLPNHQFLPPEGVNVYDLLRFEHLVLTKDAAAAIQKRFSGENA